MWYIWLILIFLLLLIEFFTSTSVAIWFAISALISLIIDLFKVNFGLELIVFIVVGLVLLIALRTKFNEKIKNFIRKVKRKK